MKQFVSKSSHIISKSFAENMPDWVVAKYFDPECERQRLLVHDYQQTEIKSMRCMDNTKLVDSLALELKSFENVLEEVTKILSSGLELYLHHNVAPFVGDWPMQFFIRKLVYSDAATSPSVLKNVVPLIGSLHISLNARECVVLMYHEIFAELYKFLFGENAKLALKPQPWRISLLLEIIYGGWTLIRDVILPVFDKCKNIEYLTLLNLLDNYVPLVLSIYSVIFKYNKLELYQDALLHCWVMFVVFGRRHYNKALLVMLSLIQHWQENSPSMSEVMRHHLAPFDEYPVGNFHSILRGRTKETDSAEQISMKAKEIDKCKHELHSFKATFVPTKRFNFSSKKINILKEKAAVFLAKKFEILNSSQNMATLQPRARRQLKSTTKWMLPNLFGEKIVTNKILPLGFMSTDKAPNPNK